jgi:hypothetical protein
MEYLEKIQYKADVVIKMYAKTEQIDLNFDKKAVAFVYSYISENRRDFSEKTITKLISIIGSFLKECVRLNYGGNWKITNNELSVKTSDKVTVFPYSKVRKHFQNGSEDSILSFFS